MVFAGVQVTSFCRDKSSPTSIPLVPFFTVCWHAIRSFHRGQQLLYCGSMAYFIRHWYAQAHSYVEAKMIIIALKLYHGNARGSNDSVPTVSLSVRQVSPPPTVSALALF